MAEFLRLRQQQNVLSKPARKIATDDARRRKTAAVGFGDADDLVRLSHFVRSPAFRRKFSLHPMNIQPIYRLKPGLQANLEQWN